ncbi:helix-turn-helix transcriptional regulator [Motilimonas eburnea]|nr:AlpA family phage regulatory protein [Motilimonas eburnea]MCE2572013.1 AlpA family phage regulatory protein [Motilimonas eburnea]
MPNKPIRLIRLKEVLAMTGLSRSGVYRSIQGEI